MSDEQKPEPIAETLRAAAKQLRAWIERAQRENRSFVMRPAEAFPYADMLVAVADEMDGYGPDEDGRGGPVLYRRRDGVHTVGLDLTPSASPTDLETWTAAHNGARAIFGDDTP